VVKLAVVPVRLPVPNVLVPSLKVTEPVGVPVPVATVTVAVNVTDCPTELGFTEEVILVVVVPTLPTV
jgi:hypothetical protein